MNETDSHCILFPLKSVNALIEKAKETISARNVEFKSLFFEWCEIVQKCGQASRDYINTLEKVSRISCEKSKVVRSVELNGLNCSFTTLGDTKASYMRPFANYTVEELPILSEIFPNLCDFLTASCSSLLAKYQNYIHKMNEQNSKLLSIYIASRNKSAKKNYELVKKIDKKSVTIKNTKSKMSSSMKYHREAYYHYALFMHETAVINQGLEFFKESLFHEIINISDGGFQILFTVFFEGLIGVLDLQTKKIPPYSSLLSSIITVFSMDDDEFYYNDIIKKAYSEYSMKNLCKYLHRKPKIIADGDNEYLEKFSEILFQNKERLAQCQTAFAKMPSLEQIKKNVDNLILDGYNAKLNWKAIKPKITSSFTNFEDRLFARIKMYEAEISVKYFSALIIEANSQATVTFFTGAGLNTFNEILFPTGTWVNNSKIFGGSVDDHCKKSGFEISPVILFCIEKIDSLGLKTEGIFRLAGRMTSIKKIKILLEAGYYYLNCNIMEYCDVLKEYLRELEEPLLPTEFLKKLEKEVAVLRDGGDLSKIKLIIDLLPEINKKNLQVLCKFLNIVSGFSDFNKMTQTNLALIFATNINNKNIANILDNTFIKVIYTLISNAHQLFTETLKNYNFLQTIVDIDIDENFGFERIKKISDATIGSRIESEESEEYYADDEKSEGTEDINSGALDTFKVDPNLDDDDLNMEDLGSSIPEYVFELVWLPAEAEIKSPGTNLKQNCFDGWRISGLDVFSEKNKVQTEKKLDINLLNSIIEDLLKYWRFNPIQNENNELETELLECVWLNNGERFNNEESYFAKCLELRSRIDVDKILTDTKIVPSSYTLYTTNDLKKAFELAIKAKPRIVIQQKLLVSIQIFLDSTFSPIDSPYKDTDQHFRYLAYATA